MGEDLVLLASTLDAVEANIWRKSLDEEGIPVLVRQDDPLGPLGVHHLGARYDIYVLRRDERRARFLLGLPPQG